MARQIYREEESQEDLPFDGSCPKRLQRLELSQSKARSQELPPGLPRGCRVPRLQAILNCFPKPQAESWMESGAARIRAGAQLGSQHIQDKDFHRWATVLGPVCPLLNLQNKSSTERADDVRKSLTVGSSSVIFYFCYTSVALCLLLLSLK